MVVQRKLFKKKWTLENKDSLAPKLEDNDHAHLQLLQEITQRFFMPRMRAQAFHFSLYGFSVEQFRSSPFGKAWLGTPACCSHYTLLLLLCLRGCTWGTGALAKSTTALPRLQGLLTGWALMLTSCTLWRMSGAFSACQSLCCYTVGR